MTTDYEGTVMPGTPIYVLELVLDGVQHYEHIKTAMGYQYTYVGYKYYKDPGDGYTSTLVLFIEDKPVRYFTNVKLEPNFSFRAEGNGKHDGDRVDAYIQHMKYKINGSEEFANGGWYTSDTRPELDHNKGVNVINISGDFQDIGFQIKGIMTGMNGGDWDSRPDISGALAALTAG
jgi:hypothetical protein